MILVSLPSRTSSELIFDNFKNLVYYKVGGSAGWDGKVSNVATCTVAEIGISGIEAYIKQTTSL